MLRKTRIILATVMFALVTLLFLDFTGTLHRWIGWAAKIQFLPALLALNTVVVIALVALTLVCGRIYCSVICPLGVTQDIIARLRKKRNPYRYSPAKTWLRYAMLAVMIVALVAGVGAIAALLEPYSSFGRMVSNLLQPIYIAGNNCLAYLAERMDSYAFYGREVWIRSLPTFVIAVATLVIIAVLAFRGGRTYCNTICPVGTLLGIISRHSWMKIHIDTEKCTGCGLCGRNCKASCIDTKNHKVDYSRCVVCGDCIDKCNEKAISFGIKGKAPADKHATGRPAKTADRQTATADRKSQNETVDRSKRHFLLAGLATVGTAALAEEKVKLDGGLAELEKKVAPKRQTPLTPPGSMSAKNMYQHCTGCQLCVSACPNDVLRPSASLDRLMQPEMSYEHGYCRPECNRCSTVCPAGAIKPITPAVKSATHIGHAVWIKKNCIPVADGVNCGNCARHCPVGAITMVPLDKNAPLTDKEGNDLHPLMIPVVNEEMCIGCGACENLCPARPFSAIYVEGHETHRTK